MTRSQVIPWGQPHFWGNEQQYVVEALASSWISGGPFVDRFESDFTRWTGSRCAITTSNGTTALHMAFLGLGVKPGDEIIVPGFGFLAAANVALHVGARPVFAEVDPSTWCVTAESIEAVISARTKAVVPIHTYGNVCAMDEIIALANERHIWVVEDTAEAFASRYKGRLAGTMGTVGTYSFQATKTISTGEGGMVVTMDVELDKRMRLYRNHGMLKTRYWHEVIGHNFRLTNLQAALGCAQIEKIDRIIAERRRVHEQYQVRLSKIPGLLLQDFPSEVDPVLWAIAVRLDPSAYPSGRDKVMEELAVEGIETRPGFYPPSVMDVYSCPKLPICEQLSRQILSLPTYPTLSEKEIDFICSKLSKLMR
jgi:perosamine synthetase